MKKKMTVKELLAGKKESVEILTTKVEGSWHDIEFKASRLGFHTQRQNKQHKGFSEYYIFTPKK